VTYFTSNSKVRNILKSRRPMSKLTKLWRLNCGSNLMTVLCKKLIKQTQRVESSLSLWPNISSPSLFKENLKKFLYPQSSHKLNFYVCRTAQKPHFQQNDSYTNICRTQNMHLIRKYNFNMLHPSAWCKLNNTQGKIIYDYVVLYALSLSTLSIEDLHKQ
jgi:hypothetical protein